MVTALLSRSSADFAGETHLVHGCHLALQGLGEASGAGTTIWCSSDAETTREGPGYLCVAILGRIPGVRWRAGARGGGHGGHRWGDGRCRVLPPRLVMLPVVWRLGAGLLQAGMIHTQL